MKKLALIGKQIFVVLMLLLFGQAVTNPENPKKISPRLRARGQKTSSFTRIFGAFTILLICSSAVHGAEVPPPDSIVVLQTNGPSNALSNGDWYTNTGGGGNGYHYFALYVPPLWPTNTPIHVDLFSPEMNCNSSLDEQDGATPGNTQFELYNVGTVYSAYATPGPGAAGSLRQTTYTPVGATGNCTNQPAEKWVRFYTIAAPVPGTYLLRIQTFDNNQNGWRLRFSPDNDNDPATAPPVGIDNPDGLPGTADELGIGVLQASYQHNATGSQCVDQFQVVAGNLTNITFNNFDMDSNTSVTYYAPNGASTTGTVSGSTVWNRSTTTARVGDVINNPASGIWQARTCFNAKNQIIQEMQTGKPYFLEGPNVPAMTLRKDDGVNTVASGQPTTYTLSFTNEIDPLSYSGAAVNVQLVDTLPTGVTYNSCAINPPYNGSGSSCSYNSSNRQVTYTLSPKVVPAGGSGSVTLTVTSNTNSSFTNTAQMTYDHEWGVASYTVTATDTDNPPMQVTKTSNATGPLLPGNTVNYTIQITNTSATTQTGIVVNDTLPAGLTYVPRSTLVHGYVKQGNGTTPAIKDNIPNNGTTDLTDGAPPNLVTTGDEFRLTSNQSMTVTYRATVNSPPLILPQNIINTAQVTSTQQTQPLTATVSNPVFTASIGDQVWLDANGNGIKDVGEAGLANVKVVLYRNGTPVNWTLTGTNGRYLFPNLVPGSYTVGITTSTLPSGLTLTTGTNPTATITVDGTSTQYLNADFGYRNTATGSATIGDTVWSDANGNGVREAGESGLSGIAMRLWQDTNSNGSYEPGVDTLVATTTTDANGTYRFTGVAPSTYRVTADTGNTLIPAGYTLTYPTGSTVVITVAADDTALNADFGYRNPALHSITDTVWTDANGNGVKDAGETGLAGVTVNLRANGNIMATAVTGADGSFTFPGLPNGGYTVEIADTAGVLAGTSGTTAAAVAGWRDVTLSGSDVTGTSFGYNQPGAIGGVVFADGSGTGGTNGNGVQDPGEPGIGTVQVILWKDNDGDGQFNPTSDTQVATTTTSANGSFRFTGQAAGTYFTSIVESGQTVLNGYSLSPGTSDVSTQAGTQLKVTLATANSSYTSANYGYQKSLPSVSGTVWSDTNHNGSLDSGEPGLGGVTVALLNSSGSVVATTTTNSSGAYTFSNVAAGSYTIKVTDTNSVLRDYSSTTGGDTQSVTVSGSNVTGKNFGYYKPVPTYAPISKLLAYAVGNDVIVEWRTAVESGTLGFFLERLDPETGLFVALHDALLPGFGTSPRGGSYWFLDKTAQPKQRYTYRLIEVEMDNHRNEYGPFEVKVKDNGEQQIADWDATLRQTFWQNGFAQQRKEPSAQEIRDWNNKRDQRQSKHRAKPKKAFKEGDSQLRILVNAPGLYKLTVAEIADAFGVKTNVIENYLRKGKLALSNGGQPVAYAVAKDNSALYFYGQGLDTVYTDANVYWLGVGDALLMTTRNTTLPKPDSVSRTFQFTQRWTKNLSADVLKKFIPWLALTGEPDGDYWYWGHVYLEPGTSSVTFSSGELDAPGAVNTGLATVAVELRGGSESTTPTSIPDHHVEVSVNGVVVGSGQFNGTDYYRFEAPFNQGVAGAPVILSQGNIIEVRGLLDQGVPSSSFGVKSIELTYPRVYQAVSDTLAFGTGNYPAVTVEGFTGSDVTVLDISDARRPVTVAATVEAAPAGGYRVAVAAQSAQNAYLATTLSAAKSPKELVLDNVSTLKDTKNAADYLVIAPDSLQGGAEALVALRDTKQMKALYVDLQDIYNTFNYGVEDAHAIKDFLTYAYGHWKKAPAYVALAGKGTIDPRNLWGFSTNVLPVLLVDSPNNMIASDNRYADVVGNDGVPEIAIGRIPVLSDDELLAYADKLRNAEAAAALPDATTWRKRAIMIADAPHAAGNFPADSESVIPLLPSGMSVERDYYQKGQGETYDQTFRSNLLSSINSGAGLVNYVGHGSLVQLGMTGFFSQGDVAALTNGSKLPIMAGLTCTMGWDTYPGWDSLARTLTLSSTGGIAAALAPSGFSYNDFAVALNKAFVTNVATMATPVRIGDVVIEMLYQSAATVPRFMIDMYSVTGDPAAVIPFRVP